MDQRGKGTTGRIGEGQNWGGGMLASGEWAVIDVNDNIRSSESHQHIQRLVVDDSKILVRATTSNAVI